MSSVVHSVLGAALLLTGASAAMAQSATAPVANQPVQAGAAAAPVAAPVAYQQVQAGAPAPAPVVAAQPKKPTISDQSDRYGGHDPNSVAGTRAFWEALNPY
jgi:hypothetical protein